MSKSKLLEKYKLNNNVEIKNHIVITPITIAQSTTDGSFNDEEKEYLENRATNIGIFVFGATEVSQEGVDIPCRPRALSEKDLPSLSKRANLIKSQGAKAVIQLDHRGYYGNIEYSGLSPVAPSEGFANEDLKNKNMYSEKNKVHELTNDEILKLIEKYGIATELCMKAGFEGVEIHAANFNLLQQFLSPHSNKRTDDWGGSNEKRMNLILKIVDEVCKIREKNKCPEFIIGCRLSTGEPFEDGLTMTDTLKLIKILSSKPLQYISITQKNFFQKTKTEEGIEIEKMKIIHQEIEGKMALIGAGGLKSGADFNSAMDSGFCELIGAGTASMLNPNLGILLEKGEELNVKVDPEHPEYYKMTPGLWKWFVIDANKKEEDKRATIST